MHIFVGSTNPVKLNAVQRALSEKYADAKLEGFSVASGVSDQPSTDEETKTGAINRARAALAAGLKTYPKAGSPMLGIGLEGGVFTTAEGEMWSTVWVAVVDEEDRVYVANGGRVPVPTIIAVLIAKGEEMGPVMEKLTGEADVRKKQGMFGVITKNYVDRAEEYGSIAKVAIGLWHGRDWAA